MMLICGNTQMPTKILTTMTLANIQPFNNFGGSNK